MSTRHKIKCNLYDVLIYGLVPLHISVMISLMYLSSIGHFSTIFEMIGAIFTVEFVVVHLESTLLMNLVTEVKVMNSSWQELFC